jgi:CrcB protein
MKKYIFIACGGFLGAILRVVIKGWQIPGYSENIPLNTLIINVVGSFLLALILTIAYEVRDMNADVRLGIATGFLGAFTTFSTLCKETVALLKNGEYFSALSYVTVSVMLGFAAAYFGMVLACETVSKVLGKEEEEAEGDDEN